MSAPSFQHERTGWPAGIDACDRCLALSQLTIALGRVPLLRLEPPKVEVPEGSGNWVRVVFPAPLLDCADGLAPMPGELVRAVDRVLPESVESIAQTYRRWDADAVRATAFEANLTAFCQCSKGYPPALRDLTDLPPVVYLRGDLSVLERCPSWAVSMVGTRRPTQLGRGAARRIAGGIARSGAVVVSGMALGIDAASHDGELAAGGPTVAVLASGADRPTPVSNRRLYDQILERGTIVSEMPPGIQPFKWSFPARNRIIAALGRATIVVEAPLRSGALITVEHALDLGRDTFAVPGSLASDVSEGTNRMLRDGSAAVLDGMDLAGVLWQGQMPVPLVHRDGPLAELHDLLARTPLSTAEIERKGTSLTDGELELALLDLELAGWIARRPDGRYRITGPWHH